MSFGTKISEIEQEIAENKSGAHHLATSSLNKLLDTCWIYKGIIVFRSSENSPSRIQPLFLQDRRTACTCSAAQMIDPNASDDDDLIDVTTAIDAVEWRGDDEALALATRPLTPRLKKIAVLSAEFSRDTCQRAAKTSEKDSGECQCACKHPESPRSRWGLAGSAQPTRFRTKVRRLQGLARAPPP